jgi:hypothetical protein
LRTHDEYIIYRSTTENVENPALGKAVIYFYS